MKQQKILSLLFHEVTNDPTTSGYQTPTAKRYLVKPDAFRSHLKTIADSGLSVTTSLDHKNDQTKMPILVTFDDGGRSSLESADILEEFGWRGFFYIVGDRINAPRFLSDSQIRDLHKRGHIIGSHSQTHPRIFFDLTYTQMLEEWTTSKKVLEDCLGAPVPTAAIPGGDMNTNTMKSAEAAGYTHLFTSEPELKTWNYGNLTCLGRFCIRAADTVDLTDAWIHQKKIKRQKVIRVTKNLIKRALGPIYTGMTGPLPK